MLIYIDMELPEKEKQLLKSNIPEVFELYFQSDGKDDYGHLKKLKAADIILGNPNPDRLQQAKNLKWIQLHSAGFEKYRGLSISAMATNMQDFYSQPCAETMLAGIMALYRSMDAFSLLKEKKCWVGASMRMQLEVLHHKKIIILGTGNIARRVAKLLSAFDAHILFYGRTATDAAIKSKDELLAQIPQADVILGCLPGTPETKGFFTTDMIDSMQRHALFCNVGRGNLLQDENALIDALLNHKIGGAVLDVTAAEPIPPDSRLWDCPNTILSQHSGGGQKGEFEGIVELFLQNLHQYLNDQPLQNRIDLMKGY